MVVKIQDGSVVLANELLAGDAQDDEGKALKFLEVLDAPITTFQAVSKMNDGSERTRIFSFGLADTKVRVTVTTKTPEQIKAEEQAAAVAKKAEEDAAAAQRRSKALEGTQTFKTEKAFKTVSPPQKSNNKNNKK